MSKQFKNNNLKSKLKIMALGREDRENQMWDLHETTESAIPLEFTEEIKPELFGLEIQKATEMTSGLSTIFAEREVLKKSYVDVIELPITEENLQTFKELRLKIVKNRTQGIEKWHKDNKAFYLAGGRFVDAVKNKEITVNEQMEEKLLAAEKHFENLEKERLSKLQAYRVELISKYVDNASMLDLSSMTQEVFDSFLLGSKTSFEAKIESERIAEEERIAKEKAEAEAREAQRLENEKLKAEAEARELQIKKEREEAEAKQKAIQDEADKKAREEKEKQDAILKAEREAKEKIERELQAKKDAETKAENERLEAEKKAKLEAEKNAKAPIKKQMSIWVDSFDLPANDFDNEKSKLIIEKFNSFKKWAKTEIDSL